MNSKNPFGAMATTKAVLSETTTRITGIIHANGGSPGQASSHVSMQQQSCHYCPVLQFLMRQERNLQHS